jgi:hypothetical protein
VQFLVPQIPLLYDAASLQSKVALESQWPDGVIAGEDPLLSC